MDGAEDLGVYTYIYIYIYIYTYNMSISLSGGEVDGAEDLGVAGTPALARLSGYSAEGGAVDGGHRWSSKQDTHTQTTAPRLA